MLKKILFGLIFTTFTAGAISIANAAETGLAPQTSVERGVKVTVTPQNLSEESKTWNFEISLETHTHPLDVDLAKSSKLIANGKQYMPLGWEGAPPGGHHRKGSLRFNMITPQPSSVALQIHLTGEDAPRIFQWSLKGASNGY